MKGKYEIEVYDNHIAYHLEIKRNITVIQGDSGTGKTQLIRMLEDYNRAGKSSGIVLRCEKECIVPNVMDWENYLRGAHEKIFFIDENTPYLRSKAFAEIVNHSDNYFVLICRDDLPQLAYSVEEIYGMQKSRDTQKYVAVRRTYNELYHLYNVKEVRPVAPDIVVTEDSNAGFDCFCELFPQKCISANGKSRRR